MPVKKTKTARKCLRCDKQFLSEGKHNRLCGICRGRSDTCIIPYSTHHRCYPIPLVEN